MLDMLAEDSSDSVPAETLAVATIPEPEKTLISQRPDSTRPKRPAEGKKKKKRRLRRVSCLNQDAGPSALAAEEVPVELFTGVDPNGCDPADADPNGCDLDDVEPSGCNPARADPNGCDVCIIDEDEEEEEEIPLIWKNSQRYIISGESSEIPSPALSALVGLQELSLTNFDQALEDVVPEDLLSEPTDGGMMDVCTDLHDVRLELSRAASRASSTLARGLQSQEADLDCSIPMEVAENPTALDVAAAENLVPKDGASICPAPEGVAGDDPAWVGSASYDSAPEGVRAGSPSHTSMDVHVGSSPPHSDCMAATRASNQEVALETGALDARALIPAGDAELVSNDALQTASVDDPSSSHQLASHDLGLPLFVSNLLVICLFLIWVCFR
jgi:hypothetical protein